MSTHTMPLYNEKSPYRGITITFNFTYEHEGLVLNIPYTIPEKIIIRAGNYMSLDSIIKYYKYMFDLIIESGPITNYPDCEGNVVNYTIYKTSYACYKLYNGMRQKEWMIHNHFDDNNISNYIKNLINDKMSDEIPNSYRWTYDTLTGGIPSTSKLIAESVYSLIDENIFNVTSSNIESNNVESNVESSNVESTTTTNEYGAIDNMNNYDVMSYNRKNVQSSGCVLN